MAEAGDVDSRSPCESALAVRAGDSVEQSSRFRHIRSVPSRHVWGQTPDMSAADLLREVGQIASRAKRGCQDFERS
jgi:hypothetical protein